MSITERLQVCLNFFHEQQKLRIPFLFYEDSWWPFSVDGVCGNVLLKPGDLRSYYVHNEDQTIFCWNPPGPCNEYFKRRADDENFKRRADNALGLDLKVTDTLRQHDVPIPGTNYVVRLIVIWNGDKNLISLPDH